MRTQQMRTIRHMNMHICNGWDCEDNWWPTLEPTYTIPNGLVHFEVADSWKHPDEFCHFFIDDYRFERLWDRPENYLDILRRYAGVIMPDYSTYTDMPVPMQMWNVYRARALAHYWQQEGIDVIPNLMFSDEASYEWIFDGIPKYSVIAVSTVGVYRNPEYRKELVKGLEFVKGLEYACKKLQPAGLVMYGSKVEFDANDAEVYWYKNDNSARVKQNIAKRKASEDGEAEGQRA